MHRMAYSRPEVSTCSRFCPSTTVSPHKFYSLPDHEQMRRMEYLNNSFIQLLHQHQLIVNVTDCWVCGLIPHNTQRGMPYLVLPFSYEGSAWAYLAMFSNAYQNLLRYPSGGSYNGGVDFSHSSLIKGIVTMAKIADIIKIPKDEKKAYDGWNITRYTLSLIDKLKQQSSTPIWVLAQRGYLCLQINGQNTKTKQERSNCSHTYVYTPSTPAPLVASQGTYFICHDKAYTWLPPYFSGTCYIAFLLPPTYTAPADYHKKRVARGVLDSEDTAGQEGGDFLKGFLPFWGPMANSKNIRQLIRVVDATINVTSGSLKNLTAELQADRLMTLQNRMVLDIILADKGGVCKLIGSSCCIYIPDNAPTVHQAISKLHVISESIHQDTGDWSVMGWFWGLLSTWGWKVLTFLGMILALVFSCCLCLQCGPAICGLCAMICVSKPVAQQTEHIKMMVQQHLSDLMTIDIDSD
ncbi:endogenous retrovirus group PABLB member 1 Env polyprotein-like [Lissotriton helveticus]